MTDPTTLGALFRRAGDLLVRRWPLYAGATLVAFAIQAALLFRHDLDPNVSLIVGEVFAFAPLCAIVVGFGTADCAVDPVSGATVWSRIAERIWIVVFIDAALNLLGLAIGAEVGTGAVAQTIAQVGILILSTLLAFAEIHAIAAPDENPARLLGESLLTSVRITTTRIGYARAVGLVFLPYLVEQLTLPHLWAFVAVVALVQAPVTALALVFYLDCLARMRESSR